MKISTFFKVTFLGLSFTVNSLSASGNMSIVLEFSDDSLSRSQKSVFKEAADRWKNMILGSTNIPSRYNLTIEAKGITIDGENGILAQAKPTRLWNNIPIRGIMSFDIADLKAMEREGTLYNVITHEMGHVLGFGTLWETFIRSDREGRPLFVGTKAMQEYGYLLGYRGKTQYGVPVANSGGAGTYGSHWSESVFGNELMTGYIQGSSDPISRMTLAAFSDLGYTVRMEQAESYQLPTSYELKTLRIRSHSSSSRLLKVQDNCRLRYFPQNIYDTHYSEFNTRSTAQDYCGCILI